MAEITANLIKDLRERTGVGMGKCKEALVKADGDIELAIANLRKEGMTSAVKKQGRETKEGMIVAGETPSMTALVEGNAETDFVVKNDRFQKFLQEIAEEVAKTSPASLELFMQQRYSGDPELTIDQYRSVIVQALGENIQVSRLILLPKQPNHSLAVYSHLGGKMVTFVEIEGAEKEEELARAIAMHVAAAAPEYLAPEDVPAAVIEQEKEIARVQVVGKPDFVVNKILDNKINDFYATNCLNGQKYIRDDSLTVEQFVQQRAKEIGKKLKIKRFLRWNVGEAQPSA